MKKIAGAALAMLLAGATVTPALADKAGADWISIDKVVSILKDAGYGSISEIEADDGHWEGEARRGRVQYEFHVDPRTGAVTKLERDR